MEPEEILNDALIEAQKKPTGKNLNKDISEKLEYICRSPNRAGVRFLMACLLAKIHRPEVDSRKPYTEIGTKDSFSGRAYDEKYIRHFINKNQLPCNTTTAFLTPGLRNVNRILTIDTEITGRPKEVYKYAIQLLDLVYREKVSAKEILVDTVRRLLVIKNEKNQRMKTLIKGLKQGGGLPLSSEAIVTLITQHLACKNSSRLPVLIVTAAYTSAKKKLGKMAKPLRSHNSADLQTGAIGDVEICLAGNDSVVTAYEMKMKRITTDDIDDALQKIARAKPKIQNYIFITTELIEPLVFEYAKRQYTETGGVEVAILDCIGFLRHFLHLFNELRQDFLNTYQELVLKEPESAVSQPLKEAFLALRQAAEAE